MDIQEKEWGSFVEYLKTKGIVKIGRNALGVITNLVREGSCTLGYNDLELMWETWRDAKVQAVPEGFVVMPKEPTPKMIDATWDFDDEIQEMSHNTRNEFIYKTMLEAQEPTND